MDREFHLITEQDIHAYVDGQLSRDRQRAVEAFLAERELSLEQAIRYLRNSFDLRALKDDLYRDAELKAEIDRLMARRKGS